MYFAYFYVAGAVINGINFLVSPEMIEQKLFFSYFNILLGNTKVYLTDLMMAVGLLSVVIQFLLRKIQIPRGYIKNHLSALVGIFMIAGISISLTSVRTYGKSALGDARIILFTFLFFIALCCFTDRVSVIKFLKFFVSVSLVRCILNLMSVFIAPAYLSYQRPFGSNSDATYYLIGFLLLLTVGDSLIESKTIRRAIMFLFVVSSILITARSSILSFAVSLLVYLLISRKANFRQLAVASCVILGVTTCLAVIVVYVPAVRSLFEARFLAFFQDVEADPTGSWRLLGWVMAISSIAEHPLLGIGFGSYAERFVEGQWLTVSLHNAYLDILYTMGLTGLIPFVAILGISVTCLYRKIMAATERIERNLACGILLVVVYLMIFISLNAEMMYALTGTVMWIFLGMIPGLIKGGTMYEAVRCAQSKRGVIL
jgi:O-antigen ligase